MEVKTGERSDLVDFIAKKISEHCEPGSPGDASLEIHLLLIRDPKSDDLTDLLRSFLSSSDERKAILDVPEEDAKVFLEIIDRVCSSSTFFGVRSLILFLDMKAFRAAQLELELRNVAFGVLTRLCDRIGHLPNSYLLSDGIDLSGIPSASGRCADLRRGMFEGRSVAVKSIRVSEADDKVKVRKVGDQATTSRPGSLTHCVALPQRGRRVEEHVASQRSRSHWYT